MLLVENMRVSGSKGIKFPTSLVQTPASLLGIQLDTMNMNQFFNYTPEKRISLSAVGIKNSTHGTPFIPPGANSKTR